MATHAGSARTRASERATGEKVLLPWSLVAGFLAGVVFIALNSWFAVSMGKPALGPFKTIATIVQGPPPPQATIWVGMVVHSILSALFGLGLGILVLLAARRRRPSAGWLLWVGLIYGGAVYAVDFQVFSRYLHQFSAFLEVTNQPFELSVHLVFGAVLAALLTPWTARTGHAL